MPFTASFTVSQSLDGSEFTITDTSTYNIEAKNTFSARVLYIYLYNGKTLNADGEIDTTPTAIDFSFASYPGDTITIPIAQDWAFTIVLSLTSTNPQAGSVYTSTAYFLFIYYLKLFLYSLAQYAAANRNLFSNDNFFGSVSQLQDYIKFAENAISYNDTWNAQRMIDLGYQLKNNPAYFN